MSTGCRDHFATSVHPPPYLSAPTVARRRQSGHLGNRLMRGLELAADVLQLLVPGLRHQQQQRRILLAKVGQRRLAQFVQVPPGARPPVRGVGVDTDDLFLGSITVFDIRGSSAEVGFWLPPYACGRCAIRRALDLIATRTSPPCAPAPRDTHQHHVPARPLSAPDSTASPASILIPAQRPHHRRPDLPPKPDLTT